MATPPAMRILPMKLNEEHFPGCTSATDVQEMYFLDELPLRRNGCYYYEKQSLKAEPGTVVLFQCDNSIIASAVFLRAKRFERPIEDRYQGGMYFDATSIRVFDPVDTEGIKRIWPEFERFSHLKLNLDPKRYWKFKRTLRGVEAPQLAAEDADVTESNDEGVSGEEDADRQARVLRQIKMRRGRQRFRNKLRQRYGDRCMVTGCVVLAVLEAAHISTFPGEDDNRPANGLLLRSDIHTLFDLDLLGIEPDQLRVELHPDVAKEYGRFAGKTLGCSGDYRPSPKALRRRYKLFQKRLKGKG